MLKTTVEFYRPTAEDAVWAAPLLACSGQIGCEFSYTTLYMWREMYDVTIARCGDYLFVRAGGGADASYLPPIGPSLEEGIRLLRTNVVPQGVPLRLHGVTEELLQQLRQCGEVQAQESPADFDYVYRQSDLADLPGNAYHSKKNHIAAFSRRFDWQYEPIDDGNVAEVLDMAKQWCRERGNCRDRGLRAEQCAVQELLADRERFSIVGGLIRADGKVAAFSFGSPINERVLDVHVEKALSAFPGAYAVINREFARRASAYTYLNRENDLGIEGLRRAKQSYRPAILLKKHTVTL